MIADFNVRLAAESEGLHLEPACVRAGVLVLLRDRTKGVYYVAESGGEVIGQAMITYEWSDWRNGNLWWLQSVYVKPEFRGAGVFRRLFEHIEKLAAESGEVPTLRLYMHSENERARRTYERLGMNLTHYVVFEKEIKTGA